MTQTRGEKNCNPGNLERNEIKWHGLIQANGEPRFCVFDCAENGIRALARTLLTYQRKLGLNTVRAIIDRWAPPNENDTSAYVAHVASVLNVGEDTPVNLEDDGVLEALTKAIIVHENGRCIYSDAQIKQGVTEALA
jgi:hypothetical protein